jgi:hypothetical protein
VTISGGNFEAPTIVKTGGTSTQFLKADGSVDSNTYLTTASASAAYVPYTGANANLDLGQFDLFADTILVNGSSPTSGSYLGFKHATTGPTGAEGYTSMYTFGTNIIGYKSVSGATNKDFSFDMSSITANVSGGRVYTLPDASGTIALTSDLGAYLPLAGGTLTGALNGTSASFVGGTYSAINTIDNVKIGNSGSTWSGIHFTDTTTTDAFFGYNKTSKYLAFSIDGTTEILKLSSTGEATFSSSVTAGGAFNGGTLNINTSTGSERINVNGAIGFQNTSGVQKFHVSYSTGSGGLNFTETGVADNRLFLRDGGSVGIGTDIPAATVKLDVVGDIRTSTGILFGSDTAAANALDDYEEGTFTPELSFAGGTTGITYSEQNGKYTKIGRKVTVEVEIALTSKGTSGGRVQIGNLPFSGIAAIFTAAIELRNVTFTQKYAIAEVGRAAGSFFRVIFIDSASNSVECGDSNTANNSVFFFSATYFTS